MQRKDAAFCLVRVLQVQRFFCGTFLNAFHFLLSLGHLGAGARPGREGARACAGDAGRRAFPPGPSRDSEATSGSRGLTSLRLQGNPEGGSSKKTIQRPRVWAVPRPPSFIIRRTGRGVSSLPAVSLGNVPLPTCCGNLCVSLPRLGRAGTGSKRAAGNGPSGGAERCLQWLLQ